MKDDFWSVLELGREEEAQINTSQEGESAIDFGALFGMPRKSDHVLCGMIRGLLFSVPGEGRLRRGNQGIEFGALGTMGNFLRCVQEGGWENCYMYHWWLCLLHVSWFSAYFSISSS